MERLSFGNLLATRLLRIIFGCYFLVTLAVTSVQLAAQYRHAEQRLQRDIDAMEHTFGPGIGDALWRFNDEILRGILDGMGKLPTVIGVRVDDAQGVRVAATGVTEDGNQGLFGKTFSRSFPIDHRDEAGQVQRIGSWTIYSSQAIVVRQVEYGFVLILVNSVVKTLALWFIFLFVINRALGRPLRQLSEFVDALHIGNLGEKVLVLKAGGRHELHLLADTLNEMVQKLRRSVEENGALVSKLEAMNRTLEAQVAERTAELLRMSMTDALTDLANRRKLDQVLGDEIERLQRYGGPLSLIMLDIDRFKEVNDSHGHQVGDSVLVALASLLRAGVRSTDTVGRWGGEEFMIVCPHTDLAGACALAESLRAQVARTVFSVAGARTCSFGVAQVAAGESATSAATRADAALYRAKDGGRNRVEASQGMLAAAARQ